ncbi:hypothetical protein BD560DRAFT_342091, partial [Blakeslea trispora]
TRRNKNSVFGKQYMNYWENRKDQSLEANINTDACIIVSSIQQLVNQSIREKAKSVRNGNNSESLDPSSSASASASSSSSTSDIPISENIAKALVQASNLASNGWKSNIIDLSSDSVAETLREHITEEEYTNIISSIKTKEVELSKNANELIKAVENRSIQNKRQVSTLIILLF